MPRDEGDWAMPVGRSRVAVLVPLGLLLTTLTTTACRTDSPEVGGYPGVPEVAVVATERVEPPGSPGAHTPQPFHVAETMAVATLVPATLEPKATRTPGAWDPRGTLEAFATAQRESEAEAALVHLLADEPFAVGVSLAEAEAEVLSWLDPDLGPVVESSQYARRAELFDSLGSTDGLQGGYGGITDLWRGPDYRDVETFGDPLIIVVASTDSYYTGYDSTDEDVSQRHYLVVVFDASSGERESTHVEFEPAILTAVDAIREPDIRVSNDALVTVTPTATRTPRQGQANPSATPVTPSPSPTPVPSWAVLTEANIPDSLNPTFRAYPLAPGSQMVWRYGSQFNRVRYQALVVTETIEAAWLQDDIAIVQSRVRRQSLQPSGPLGYAWSVDETDTVLRHVSPRSIVCQRHDQLFREYQQDLEDFVFEGLGDGFVPFVDTPFGAGRIAVPLCHDPFPSAGEAYRTGVTGRLADVEAPVGVLSDCWSLETRWMGTIWTTVCPGVGLVRYEYGYMNSMGFYGATADLIDYTTAELPEG